ncbi:MAG: glycosyltransferase [Bacteroidetes bacterium]|nr:glycosyltransferase [Bacteroidota bacterium]
MKVIHLVLGKANPERMNGVNRVVHFLSMSLYEKGVNVEIWGITKNVEDTVYPRPFPTVLFRAQPFYRDLDPQLMHRISKQQKGTIFHIHWAFINDFYKVVSLLKDLKIPFVYTPHGAFNKVALEKNKWVKKVYFNRYEKVILKEAKKVQFLGQSEFDNMANLMRLQNKVVVPNGQDFKELNFEFHKMQRRQSPVFGFCGRLDIYYKGLDLLVEGFAAYCKKGGEGELWLIGDGPDRPKLEALSKSLHVNDRIVFMGARYGKDKLNRIANMDLFCHPSRSEGSPTAVLEAGALGIALMVSTATNVGQEVEQYGAGLHLRKSTSKTIETTLSTFHDLYLSKEYLKMGERAREMVAEEFNWNAIAGRMLEIYKA